MWNSHKSFYKTSYPSSGLSYYTVYVLFNRRTHHFGEHSVVLGVFLERLEGVDALALRDGHIGEVAVEQLPAGTPLLVPRVRLVCFESAGV